VEKRYLLFPLTLIIFFIGSLTTNCLSQTTAKKAPLTQEELDKLKEMEELLMGKGELSAIASTYLQKKWELPSAVYVVTSKDIKEIGSRRLTDFLRLAPGVSVSSRDRSRSSVAIRGLRSPVFRDVQLASFLDDRFMQSPDFGGTFWEQLPVLPGEIDRIEIMRGPGSALYGTTAVTGVISVITKDPEKTHGLSLSSGLGSQETTFGDIMFGDGVGNFDYRIATSYERDAGFGDHNGMGIPDTVRYSKTAFRGKYRFTPELSAELLAGVTYGNDQQAFAAFRERLWEHQMPYIHTRLRYKLSDAQELLLQHYWQMHSFQERDPTSPVDVKETMQEWLIRHSIQLGERNRLVWGANLRNVRVKDPTLGAGGAVVVQPDRWQVKDVRDHDTVTGAFIQDEIKLLENLRATLGVKFEHNTFTDSDYAGRASLVYAPWKEHAFRWSVARAFRAPNFVEDAEILPLPQTHTGEPPNVSFTEVGNKRLDNETVRSMELGYTGRFFKKLDVNIETFYYDYDSLILDTPFTEIAPDVFESTFANLDNAIAKGIELDLKYPITR
jgi:iron complex outermembrane receptor protein